MKSTLFIFLLSLAFASASIGHAEVVSFQITAEVEIVSDPDNYLGGSILVNDILTGVLQYDTSLADSNLDSDYGSYDANPPSGNFVKGTNGGFGSFETTDFFGANVINGKSGNPDEVHFFVSGDTNPTLLSLVDFVDIDIDLIGVDAMVFSSDGLPTTLDLNSFSSAVVYFSAESSDGIGGWDVHFEVKANIISISSVPEPSSLTLLMMVSGVLGTVYRMRR